MPSSDSKNEKLTHFDESGKAYMVDIANKPDTHRVAVAKGTILMKQQTWDQVKSATADKGDVLGIARTAAIMGAKRTSELIPLCHPLSLTHIAINFQLHEDKSGITCFSRVETVGKTGVEMEALMAVQTALLTIYDMMKAIDKGMVINEVRLVQKTGGQSGSLLSSGKKHT